MSTSSEILNLELRLPYALKLFLFYCVFVVLGYVMYDMFPYATNLIYTYI